MKDMDIRNRQVSARNRMKIIDSLKEKFRNQSPLLSDIATFVKKNYISTKEYLEKNFTIELSKDANSINKDENILNNVDYESLAKLITGEVYIFIKNRDVYNEEFKELDNIEKNSLSYSLSLNEYIRNKILIEKFPNLSRYDDFIISWRKLLEIESEGNYSTIDEKVKQEEAEEEYNQELDRTQYEILNRFKRDELQFFKKDDNGSASINLIDAVINSKENAIVNLHSNNDIDKIKQYIKRNNIVLRDSDNKKPYDTIDEDERLLGELLKYLENEYQKKIKEKANREINNLLKQLKK